MNDDSETIRILYMDDDEGLARLLRKRLRRHGHDVDLACDGETGLKMLEETAYDLVLVDYNMPGLCGNDVIRAMAERGSLPPTIMVTGNGDERVAVEAMKLGATDYLVKDVEMNYLELLPMIIKQVQEKQRLLREKEQMIKKIRENEERYRRLVELTPDGIAVIVDQRLAFVNPSGVGLLGYDEFEEILEKPLFDFVHKESETAIRHQLDLIIRGKEKAPWIEAKLTCRDGRALDAEVSGIPFIYQDQWAILFIFRDITERKLAQERLEYMAHYDPLTALPNRTLFFDRLDQTLRHAQRYQLIFSLLFLDLDRFKEINDTMGHDVGDLLLKIAAERIRSCVRSCDTVARMGGDEFTVILTRITEPDNSMMIAEKIIESLQQPFDLNGKEGSVGASIGVSIYPKSGDNADSLLQAADAAMYQAKRDGRGQARIAATIDKE